MSVTSEITRIKNNIAVAYDEAEAKGATMPATKNSDNLADTVASIPQGGGGSGEKTVFFYDYDGTLLYSYTAAEALALSSLPALPTHSGLVAQKWNSTLAAVKAYAQAGKKVNIGCLYDTDDGSTKLYLKVVAGTALPSIALRLRLSPQSSLTIEWGDGTSSVVSNSDVLWQNEVANHNYTEAETDTEICIRISGNEFELNQNSGQHSIFNGTALPLVRLNIGSNCSAINHYAFNSCSSLTSIAIPDSVTSIGQSAFQNCYSLTSITIPDSVTSIGQFAFDACRNLLSCILPNSITQISDYLFRSCGLLYQITIPASVTSIGNMAFYSCSNLNKVDLSEFTDPIAIPTLANTNVFYNMPGKFIVANAEMLAAFRAATNWSSFESTKWEVKT